MQLHELIAFTEERKKRKRLGRGAASGQGTTSGKGHKGQNSRSGGGVPAGFEGGQMPMARRLPKRGFKNRFRVEYHPVNLDRLSAAFEDVDEISLDAIYEKGLAPRNSLVKILGRGEAGRAFKVEAHRFSSRAAEKIAAAGGEARSLEGQS
jgi:large subunit ribosomal protein L15